MGRYSLEALEKGRRSSEQKFIEDASAKFGGKFDYSQVKYVRQKVSVEIVCPDHGVFTQTPDKHLQSICGCPNCGVGVRAGKKVDAGGKKFLETFRAKFADSLELLSEYVSINAPIKFKCKRHDLEFERTPDALNIGRYGCPLCANEHSGETLRLTLDQFKERAIAKFGDLFDLSQVDYTKNTERVRIGCPVHGQFSIVAASFLSSAHGCPKCGKLRMGYAANQIQKLEQGLIKPRPTRLAVMKVEVFGITAYKLGTTSRSLLDRYALALREVLLETTLNELDALKLERHLHGKYFRGRDVRIFLAGLRSGARWPGDSELYKEEFIPAILEDIKSAVAGLEKSSADYWSTNPQLEPPVLRIQKVSKSAGQFNLPKAVIRLDTLVTYPSATAAAKAISGNQGLVSMVCRGERVSTKGIKFALLSDYKSGKLPCVVDMNRGANHKLARAVRCIDTGEIYKTLTEAAHATGVNSSKITSVCRGRRKSTGGYRWEYVDL